MDRFKKYIYRSFVWNGLNLFFCIFNMFYLVKFDEIKNWNCVLVFLPLLIIAISSESMTRNKTLRSYRVRPYSLIDFVLKLFVFILSEIAYRKISEDKIFYILFFLIVLLGTVSFALEVLMLRKILKETK